ncbi:hypothetical protein HK099_002795 [Clydaea vesicula]|uniref:Uncharacterized protein n=1 Tax=Clydaea vesicula TaxID=447962 RepID=A0AAD5U2D1_9FUNG|nr:hypothetical protein HK099_002795 [Clydaea vesicula]
MNQKDVVKFGNAGNLEQKNTVHLSMRLNYLKETITKVNSNKNGKLQELSHLLTDFQLEKDAFRLKKYILKILLNNEMHFEEKRKSIENAISNLNMHIKLETCNLKDNQEVNITQWDFKKIDEINVSDDDGKIMNFTNLPLQKQYSYLNEEVNVLESICDKLSEELDGLEG